MDTIHNTKLTPKEKYLQAPNRCLFCNGVIMPREKERITDTRKKKFCNKSCAACHNNQKFIKRKKKINLCVKCGEEIYSKKMYCQMCWLKSKQRESKIIHKTKKEIFQGRKNWQSARTAIQKHARLEYARSNMPKKCFICGYEHHYEIAHKKAVSNFSDDSLIKDINALSNLVALCPTHHWEQEHGFLKLE